MPTGNTKFVFKAGNLNFRSTAYQWLVVTGDGSVNFKGEGLINNELAPNGKPCKFKVWAHDGDPETFRIMMWYEDENKNEIIKYDTHDVSLGGGNVKVRAKHTQKVHIKSRRHSRKTDE